MSATAAPLPHSAPRRRSSGEPIRFAIRETTLGLVLVACSEGGVCAVFLGDDAGQLQRDLREQFPGASLADARDDLVDVVSVIAAMVDDPAQLAPTFAVEMRGTTFQTAVWKRLCAIPVGQTASYAEIAVSLGLPSGARAVAQACAANALAVVVPCHRVVRTNGEVSGYRWGVARKIALLARESAPR